MNHSDTAWPGGVISLLMRWAVGILLLLAAVRILFIVIDKLQPPEDTLLWDAFFDAGHAALFGLLSIVILVASMLLLPRSWPQRRHYLLAFAVAVGLGIFTEALQVYGPRSADIGDILLNVLGTVAFLLFAATLDRRMTRRFERVGSRARPFFRVIAVLILCAAYLHFILLGVAYIQRAEAFPVICDFQSSWEGYFVDTNRVTVSIRELPEEWAKNPKERLAYATFTPRRRYPWLGVLEPYPDWSGYDRLVFTLYSTADAPVEFGLRVDDYGENQRRTDRYDGRILVQPGINRIEIPLSEIREGPSSRTLDMKRIRRMIFYANRPSSPVSIFIDGFRLE